MASHLNSVCNQFRDRVSKRLREVQKYLVQRFRYQERFLSISSLVSAICLGTCAHRASENEALQRWERTHLPSDRIVQQSIRSYGWGSMDHSKTIEKLVRTIPASLDEKGSVWASDNWNWILFFSSHSELVQPQFYCLHCAKVPTNWLPVGVGWKGLELTLEGMTTRLELEKSQLPKKKIKSVHWKDAREISF
jgi:hypothetical protein